MAAISCDPSATAACPRIRRFSAAHALTRCRHPLNVFRGADRTALPDFQGPYDVNDAFHETFVTLAYIAAVTERIGLASGVLILPQRQTALVAKQAAQVDIVSGGRLRLGIGVGWNSVEYAALGQDWHVRGRRQAEQIVLMNQLWTERAVTFEGAFDRVQHAGINPLPIQRPIPIWFGGAAEAVLRRAARIGDGWMPAGRPPDDRMKAYIDQLRGYVAAAGRDPERFGIDPWISIQNHGKDEWRRRVEAWRVLGASHLAVDTMRAGFTSPTAHIDAIRSFRDVL